MNVFLPYSDYSKSVSVLDNSRLNKQIIEAGQILSAIKTGKGWVNHPITKSFKPYPGSLWIYLNLAIREAQKRGMNPAIPKEFLNLPKENDCQTPKWLGREDFHASHRSALLRKGRADAICKTLKKFYKVRNFNNWLKDNGYNQKNQLNIAEIQSLELTAIKNRLKIYPNFYAKYGWKEPYTMGYVWPV